MRAARALAAVPAHGTVAVLLAVVVLGPALGRGYVLSYDMVVVPRQPFTDTVLGLAAMAPRAVPSDLVVAALSRALPADVVQKLLLLAVLVGACWGAGALASRLVAADGRLAAAWAGAAATVAYGWSPFLYERLVLGHWALLVGWAALPWVALRLADLHAAPDRRSRAAALAGVVVLVGVAALGSPASGAGVALLAVLGVLSLPAPVRTRLVRAAVVGASSLVLNAPWLVPSLLQPEVLSRPDASGVDAFAARPDTALGTAVSLLAGGGVWNGDVVPPGRELPLTAVLVVVALVVAGCGVPLLWHRRPVGPLVVVVGLGAWAPTAMVSTAPGRRVLELVVEGVPGGGLVRDTQKLVLPTALLLAVASGCAVAAVVRRAPAARGSALVPAAVLAAVPLLVTPALAWGAGGRLETTGYPRSWLEARRVVAADEVPGTVLVLPWNLYRRYDWGPATTVLTPQQRWFDRRTVSADDLPVRTEDGEVVVVAGEDRLAREVDPVVRELLAGDADRASAVADGLRRQGVRYVVVERGTGAAPVPEEALADLEPVVDAPELAVLRVDDPAPVDEPVPPRAAVLAGLVAAGLGLAGATLLRIALAGRGAMLLFGSRRRRPSG